MRRRPASVTADLGPRTDRKLGAMVSGAVRGHHRRRLERISWLAALDAPGDGWAAGEPPPRKESSLEILIDGAEALPRMVAELERAESHVHLAGWFFSPDFALTRGEEPAVLRDLLAELAERIEVRVGVLIVLFAVTLPSFLAGDVDQEGEPPRWPLRVTVGVLGGAGLAAAFASDWFVSALTPATHAMHMSQDFAGLVVVAIAGNAVENVVGVARRTEPS